MANVFYPSGREYLISVLLSANIKVAALAAGYAFSTAHDRRNDLTDVIGVSGNLAGKTVTAGVFNADDLTPFLTGVATDIAYLAIFRDSGDPATSELIGYLDSAGGTLPLVQDGGNVNAIWHASGILSFT